MGRMNSYKRRKSSNAGVLFGLAGLLLIAGMAGAFWYTASSHIEVNQTTLCPTDGPTAVTTVLVDCTDRIKPIQFEAIKIELKRIRQKAVKHEAFLLFAITNHKGSLVAPLFNCCNPGDGEELNRLYQNPTLAKRKWEEQFSIPLESTIEKLSEGQGFKSSPIMESIQATAISSFGQLTNECPKKLIVVSDMLQNETPLSFYNGIPDFKEFKRTESYHKIFTQYLNGVEVTILLLRNSSGVKLQGKNAVLFWQKYFADQNANLVHVKVIDG